eukprot:2989709-Rhodomonas_salina.1
MAAPPQEMGAGRPCCAGGEAAGGLEVEGGGREKGEEGWVGGSEGGRRQAVRRGGGKEGRGTGRRCEASSRRACSQQGARGWNDKDLRRAQCVCELAGSRLPCIASPVCFPIHSLRVLIADATVLAC